MKTEFKKVVEVIRKTIYQYNLKSLKTGQLHNVISKAVIETITPDWLESVKAHDKQKRACYFSAEFLMGRAIYNNLFCSGLLDATKNILKLEKINIDCFEEIEDAALGNGYLWKENILAAA